MSSGPVIPWIYEVGGYAIFFFYAAIVIWALVEVARSATLTPTKRALWVLAIVVLPLVAAVTWLILNAVERSQRRRSV
ncbi:PLDc N-terminal domain-containing protein [uncultured Leifsonia sp.]|uniref:PLDc N-terminal domain-containing protein n=1 Tax=uncultured Leifsonia sp. TaxID=340359 RepID=UPI0028D66AF6|nr:PLDc N-terminal domain-containing protein [uncultured Leifsonia sp.]